MADSVASPATFAPSPPTGPLNSPLAWLRVAGPPEPPDPVAITEALIALHGLRTSVELAVIATSNIVDVGVRCASWQAGEIERALRGSSFRWEISIVPPPLLPHAPLRAEAFGRRSLPDWAPLRDAEDFGGTDSLAGMLEALQPLANDEWGLFRCLALPVGPERHRRVLQDLAVAAPAITLPQLVVSALGAAPRVPRFERRIQRPLEDRLAEPAFEVLVHACLGGSQRTRLESRARSLAAIFAGWFDAGYGGIVLDPWNWYAATDLSRAARRRPSLYLTAAELAGLWHVPSDQVVVPGVTHLKRPPVPLPPPVAATGGLVLGVHRGRGQDVAVRLPRGDLDAGHVVVAGKTGVGKSTLQHQIARQLVAAVDGPALAVVDPHGDLVLDIAARSIPQRRVRDVVLLELGDADFPVSLPLFHSPPGVPREAVIQSTFSTLRLIFREHWSPTRMEDAVYALTATLCHMPNATLLDLPRLLNDAAFRRRSISAVDDPAALEFWSDFETLSEPGRRELARPILYRLRSLYRSPAVRNIVCQTGGLDFGEILDRGGIVLISLAGESIQAEADLLGELILARLHLALLARLSRPASARHPTYLVVDESHRYQGASLPILLREGRKLALALVLSSQYLDAWGDELAESVLGNVGALVAFRCGPRDSHRLRASIKPFTPDQLEDLDRHEAVAKLQIGGTTVPAFDLKTLPVNAAPDEALLARIRAQTRARYTRPREVVEAELHTTPVLALGARLALPGISRNGIDIDEE